MQQPIGESEPLPPVPAPPAFELGDLPTDVLNKLLAELPARDVVRTSVLSQPWRHRWESVTNLEIDLDGDRVRDWESAERFLESCAAPVRGVSIRGVPESLHHRANDWVYVMAGKSPQSVCLSVPRLLPSVFAWDAAALTNLKLDSCLLPAARDTFACFPRLTSLDLDHVIFWGMRGWTHLEAMISAAAPTLRQLRLSNISFRVLVRGQLPGGWIIQAPNLQRLELCLSEVRAGFWELGALPKLDYANVVLHLEYQRDYVRLFTALSSARELDLGEFGSATYRGYGYNVLKDLSCTFENLRILKVQTHFYEASTVLTTLSLLQKAPFLQVLQITDNPIHAETDCDMNGEAAYVLRTLPNNSDLVNNLERLHMKNIACSPNNMQFIRHVLLYARNLRVILIEKFRGHRNSALVASRMLKEFERASPAARIGFEYDDFYWLV